MLVGRVIGTVISTLKHPSYQGLKLMVVEPLHLPGEKREDLLVAVDTQHAGVGDTVLVCQEGGSTRQVLDIPNSPIRSSIIGIIDFVELNE